MKKILAIVLAIAMSLVLLGACAPAEEAPPPPANGGGEAPPPAAVTEPDDPPPPPAADRTTLVYFSMWNEAEPQADAIKLAIELFEAGNPGYTVEVRWMGRQPQDVTATAVAGDPSIDIFENISYFANPELFANLQWVMDSPAVGQEHMTVQESILSGLLIENWGFSAAAGLEGTYGIPVSPWVMSFFFNRDLFDQAGITAMPTTWDEFLDLCQQLVDAGIVPITTCDAYIEMIPNTYLGRLVGLDDIRAMAGDDNHPRFTDGSIERTIEAMAELWDRGFVSDRAATNIFPAGQQEFALGQAAMYFNASWFPGEVEETTGPDFRWGQFPFPVVAGGVDPITATTLGAIPVYVSSNSNNQAAAMNFLRYLISKQVQDYLSERGFAPATVGTPWPPTIADQYAIVANITSPSDIVPWGYDFYGDFISARIAPELIGVMTGQRTAAEALSAIGE